MTFDMVDVLAIAVFVTAMWMVGRLWFISHDWNCKKKHEVWGWTQRGAIEHELHQYRLREGREARQQEWMVRTRHVYNNIQRPPEDTTPE